MDWMLWNELSDKEKETFKTVVNKLLNQTFILESKYNPQKRDVESNPDYRFIDRNPQIFREYLDVAGWDLINDFHNGIYFIKSVVHNNPERLDKNSTMIFLVLRLIYEEKKTLVSANRNILVSVGDFFSKSEELGLGLTSMPKRDFVSACKKLRKFRILDKTSGEFADNDTFLLIYPSIIHLLDNSVLTTVIDEFQALEKGINSDVNIEDEVEEEDE